MTCLCKGKGFLESHLMKDDRTYAGIIPCPSKDCPNRNLYYQEVKNRMTNPNTQTLNVPIKDLDYSQEYPNIEPNVLKTFISKRAQGIDVVLTFNTPFGSMITRDPKEANWKLGIINTYLSCSKQFEQDIENQNVQVFPLDLRLGFK